MDHQILFFDIETKARPEAVAHLPAPTAPANYKDSQKIAAYIAEKRADQVTSAALDPDTGEIVAISMRRYPADEKTTVYLAGRDGNECNLLYGFWEALDDAGGHACGYNIIAFDLPFIMRRSLVWDVRPPLIPRLAKYQTGPISDLFGILYNWQPGKSLKTVAKLYGLPNPLPDLDGSQVADMDAQTLERYAANDVDLCVHLYKLMADIYFESPVLSADAADPSASLRACPELVEGASSSRSKAALRQAQGKLR